jgi:hypothetical protein
MNAYILVAKPQGVAEWILIGGEPGVLATLTGNSGGAISPDAGNINILGDTTTINISGNAGTSTLTVSTTGSIASLYTEDSGTAVPSGGNLVITGGTTGLTTVGSGNTVSIVGTLNAAHGGTGRTSLTAHSVLIGEGTSAVGFAGPNASTHAIFMAAGAAADPVFTTTGTPYVTGISFDAGSNTLANYAQGTFTPVLAFGGGSTGITYVDQIGTYTRIGNIIIFNVIITLSSKGSSSGAATIANFPFVPAIEVNSQVASFSNITLTAGYANISLQISGTDTFGIYQIGSGQGTATVGNTNFSNNSQIKFSGFYPT